MDKENTPPITPQMLRNYVLIWRYNSFAHHSSEKALVMYNMTSFMSHSCKPSCAWSFGQDDSFNLRSIRDLKAGEELTISYLSEEQLALPTESRRQLLKGWLFNCECERCSLSKDAQRLFKCPNCSIGEVSQSDTSCGVCCSNVDSETFQNLERIEDQYVERVGSIDETNLSDITNVYNKANNIFSSNHWVSYKLETLLIPLLRESGDKLAIILLHSRIKYLEKLGFPSYTLGWAYEEMGDFLIQDDPRKTEMVSAIYGKAYWVLRTITGPESGYSVALQNKWSNLCTSEPPTI